MVSQILAFARKTEAEVKPVQINVIVDETLKLMQSVVSASI